MKTSSLASVAGLLLVLACPPPAVQALTVTMREVGADVVMSGSGSLNLTALQGPIQDLSPAAFVYPALSSFLLGTPASIDIYFDNITFPSDFGAGLGVYGDGSGDVFGPVQYVFNFPPEIWVPAGYQSGSPLHAMATFQGESLASLGINPGVYVWTWGSGSDDETLTPNVVQANTAVPGPLPLLGACAAWAGAGGSASSACGSNVKDGHAPDRGSRAALPPTCSEKRLQG